MTSSQIVIIETILYKQVTASYESSNYRFIPHYVRQSVLSFCLENNFPLDETLAHLNPLLPIYRQIKRTDIVPETKKGQKSLVEVEFFNFLNRAYSFLDDEKRTANISKFCTLTELDPEFVSPLINKRVREEKKKLIENSLYNTLQKLGPNYPKNQITPFITEFSEVIGVTPKYTCGVLKRKIAREKELQKAKTHTTTRKQEFPDLQK